MQKSHMRMMMRGGGVVLALLAGCAFYFAPDGPQAAAAFAVITVNTTADDDTVNGNCTLREAITAANTNAAVDACAAGAAGLDNIVFNLGAGTPSIAVTGSVLPTITEPVNLNGNTGGATRVELNGAGAGGGADGLMIEAGGSTIQGLVINRFLGNGILIRINGGNTIKNCYVGTDATGTADLGNSFDGVDINAPDNTIGGTTPAERNLISGNGLRGVLISGAAATGNKVIGNYLGTDVTGTADLGNSANGVRISGVSNNTVGGTTAGERNLISGNDQSGILIDGIAATGNKVSGNYLGTDVTGTADLGNTQDGVVISFASNNTIGGTTPGERNLISGNNFRGVLIINAAATGNKVTGNYLGTDVTGTADLGNTLDGVNILFALNNTIGGTTPAERNVISGNDRNGVVIFGATTTENAILGNAIFSNTQLAIDLAPDNGVSVNDAGDADTGANNLQNFPVLTCVSGAGGTTIIQGALNSLATTSFRLEFFVNDACDGSGNGEGQTFFGAQNITTDAGGNAAINAVFAQPVAPGKFMTATATRLDGANNPVETSEFSACVSTSPVTLNPAVLPNASAGASYQQMLSATPGGTSYSFTIMAGALPPGLSLNSSTGALTGTPTVAGNYGFTIKATGFNGSCFGTRNYTLQVTACTTTVTVNPATLSGGTVGTAYSQTITASPAGTYTFGVSGSLPPGLTLNTSSGVISGTPTTSGLFSFTITATGAGGCRGSRSYSRINIACPAVTFTPPTLPAAVVGTNYNQTISVASGSGYTFSLTQGNLPPGMTLHPTTGALTGTPTAAGSYQFTIRAAQGNCSAQQTYTLTVNAPNAMAVAGDFDGDRKTDLGVWRGLQSDWLIIGSTSNQLGVTPWGAQYAPYNDVLAPGDYDGDGKVDWAVFRRSEGKFYVKCSRDGAVLTQVLGGSDTPVPADYDGDRQTDFAVWQSASGKWLIKRSSDGATQTSVWGNGSAPYLDVPVPGDYDGDGQTDVAFFRRQNGQWYVKRSSDGGLLNKAWGVGMDVVVPGDYDGDGKYDFAVWRVATGEWYVLRSSDGATTAAAWGSTAAGDVPVPGDYDGDGKSDYAVWRAPEGKWYVRHSRDNSVRTVTHGRSGDTPVTARAQP